MPPIVTDTSPVSMARCIEENMVACYAMLATMPNGVREDDGITTVETGIPISDFNGVFRTHLPPDLPQDQLDARIAATLRELDGSGMPYGWHVFPSARPTTLPDRLRARGLHLGYTSPGMAVDLQALDESTPAPEGLVIEPVYNEAMLSTWLRTSFAGFGLPAALEEPFNAAMSRFELRAGAPWQLYLGRVGDQPVATSMCLMMAGVAGLYTITTVVEHRGNGIGAAMTLAPLREARERGYRIGILEASKMGFPVYQRLGFQQYISIAHYQRPEAAG